MKILIIDDHEMIGELFSALVRQHFPQALVFVATSLKAGMQILENHKRERFAIAVIDLVLEGETGGAGTIGVFRKRFPLVPVLAISGLDAHSVAPSVYAQGAHGFLPKFCSSQEFIEAIDCVLNGRQYTPAGLESRSAKNTPSLSERQILILNLLSSGFSDKGVAKKLGITDETVAYHLQKAFRTLNASTRTQAIAEAFRQGLLAFSRHPA
jgi:two-component system, NarL family, nitrate/nitrite response regulator NarL